jgi:hypothetical protein
MASVDLPGVLDRRAFDCRLTLDRALGTLAEAEVFLQDRGLLTRTAGCALPSLYEACHEDPYKPGSPGFATWPATKCRGSANWRARLPHRRGAPGQEPAPHR